MKYLIIGLIFLCCSCANEKIVQLPDIPNATVTEVLDVSPAYIFYNEAVADSVEFNRKNIISTTNWLVNVDKRLLLKQAIPHIQYLQDKRRNAEMHKNDAAKNYYTCRDTSVNNLGFIEFTAVNYKFKEMIKPQNNLGFEQKLSKKIYLLDDLEHPIHIFSIMFNSDETIYLNNEYFSFNEFSNKMNSLVTNPEYERMELNLYFEKTLTFQDYITMKSSVLSLKAHHVEVNNTEFIY